MHRIWLLALIVCPAAAAAAQDVPSTVDLRPSFVAGRWARYEFWVLREQSNTAKVDGQSRSAGSTVEMAGEILWTVTRVAADGGAVCTMTLEWMTADVTLPSGERQHNDSRKTRGQSEATHQMLRAMADVPVTVEVGPDGSIKGVKGVDVMQRKAPEGVNVPDDLDFIETCTDLATLVAAPAQAGIGDTWGAEFLWNHPMGKMRHDLRYKLDAVAIVEGVPIATVTGTARLKLELDKSKLPAGGKGGPAPKVDVRMTSGAFTTQVLFDLDRQEAVGRTTLQDTNIRINLSYMGKSMTSTTQETVRSQVLRVAEGG